MPALAFVIANHGNQLAAIVDALRIIEKTVPVIAFGASVDQVSGHDVKGGVGPAFERIPYQCSPAIQSVLSIAHINEREWLHPIGSGGELSHLCPTISASVPDGIDISCV